MTEQITNQQKKSPRGPAQYRKQKRAARACAVQILYLLDSSGDWQWTAGRARDFWSQLSETRKSLPPEKVRTHAEELVAGVLENSGKIDEALEQAAQNWKVQRMPVTDRNIARLGIYEIKFSPKVPAAAAINEAVELAKEFGDIDSSKFINAILDRVRKNDE